MNMDNTSTRVVSFCVFQPKHFAAFRNGLYFGLSAPAIIYSLILGRHDMSICMLGVELMDADLSSFHTKREKSNPLFFTCCSVIRWRGHSLDFLSFIWSEHLRLATSPNQSCIYFWIQSERLFVIPRVHRGEKKILRFFLSVSTIELMLYESSLEYWQLPGAIRPSSMWIGV